MKQPGFPVTIDFFDGDESSSVGVETAAVIATQITDRRVEIPQMTRF